LVQPPFEENPQFNVEAPRNPEHDSVAQVQAISVENISFEQVNTEQGLKESINTERGLKQSIASRRDLDQ